MLSFETVSYSSFPSVSLPSSKSSSSQVTSSSSRTSSSSVSSPAKSLLSLAVSFAHVRSVRSQASPCLFARRRFSLWLDAVELFLWFVRDWTYQMVLQKLQDLCTVHHHLGHSKQVCTRLSLWTSCAALNVLSFAALNIRSCADWIQFDRASSVYMHPSACAYMRAE